jgi:hypothetical protein
METEMNGRITNPTYRKVLNRSYVPVRHWRDKGGWRYGWIFDTKRKYHRVMFAEGPRRVAIGDKHLVRINKTGGAVLL